MSTATLTIDTHESQPRPSLLIPLVCAWLIMFVTFSLPGTSGAATPAELGAVAKAKLVVRLLALVLFARLIWQHWNMARLRQAMFLLWPWIAFAGWAVASVAWSPLKAVSLGQSISFTALLLLSLSIAICWRSHRDTSRILFHLCCALLVASSLLLVVALAFPASRCMTRDGEGLFHATNTAATGALGLLLLLGARLIWRWPWAIAMAWPGIAIHAAVMLLSTNRVSLAMVTLLIGFYAFRYGNRLVVAIGGLIGSLVLAGYLAFDPGMEVVGGALNAAASYAQRGQTLDQLGALSGREEMWEKIWASYLQSPWIGHGYFVSSRTGELYVWYSWSNWTAHNIYLQVLVSTGLVGLSLLVLAMLRSGWIMGRLWFRGQFDRRLGALIAILGAYYAGWSLFNESIAGPTMPESVIFFTLLGLGTATACRSLARIRKQAHAQAVLWSAYEAAGPLVLNPPSQRPAWR